MTEKRKAAGALTGAQWITPEIRELLNAIADPHSAKKRYTVIAVAFAKAEGTPIARVFEDPRACNERVWWQKWQHDPQIAEALAACVKRAGEFIDEGLVTQQMKYRRDRRLAVSMWAAGAPAALADVMTGSAQRGADRINAALKLIALDDGPAEAGTFAPVGGGVSDQTVINEIVIEHPAADDEPGPAEQSEAETAEAGREMRDYAGESVGP